MSEVNPSYNFIAVAFAGAGSSPGQVTFSIDAKLSAALGGYTASQFINDVATLHAQGKKVILSVGEPPGRSPLTMRPVRQISPRARTD